MPNRFNCFAINGVLSKASVDNKRVNRTEAETLILLRKTEWSWQRPNRYRTTWIANLLFNFDWIVFSTLPYWVPVWREGRGAPNPEFACCPRPCYLVSETQYLRARNFNKLDFRGVCRCHSGRPKASWNKNVSFYRGDKLLKFSCSWLCDGKFLPSESIYGCGSSLNQQFARQTNTCIVTEWLTRLLLFIMEKYVIG